MVNFDTTYIKEHFLDSALDRFEARDVGGMLAKMSNKYWLAFVSDNAFLFNQIGIYEKALVYAYLGCSVNFVHWPFEEIQELFDIADREKLMDAGDPLPSDGPFTLYRGVSGEGEDRRERGISWTADYDKAVWFANRLYCKDPAVLKADVDRECVLAYSNKREEQEFMCIIPEDLELKKIRH